MPSRLRLRPALNTFLSDLRVVPLALKSFVSDLRTHPSLNGYALLGAFVGGGGGTLLGLAVGLNVYAAILGIPGAIVGAAVGFLAGCLVTMFHRHNRSRAA
jgi:hypothetical protein